MKCIHGKPRNQWELYCLEERVDADNEVRPIDLFVDSLNLSELGFNLDFEENGRPGLTIPQFCFACLSVATRTASASAVNSKKNANETWKPMFKIEP